MIKIIIKTFSTIIIICKLLIIPIIFYSVAVLRQGLERHPFGAQRKKTQRKARRQSRNAQSQFIIESLKYLSFKVYLLRSQAQSPLSIVLKSFNISPTLSLTFTLKFVKNVILLGKRLDKRNGIVVNLRKSILPKFMMIWES